MKEYIAYYSVRIFGAFIRCLPVAAAMWIGKKIGMAAYYFDIRHKSRAYANLKMAFAHEKSPNEIKRITKDLFKNYGRNLIELFRLPLISPEKFSQFVRVEGQDHVTQALTKGKGVIILAMHFGSWEMASLSCARLGFPYKVFVKPQVRYSKLDELLNTYRAYSGSVVLSRGAGTRDFVRSLKNNEVIGMVVDQGGREGASIPFFGRSATLSVGAIRMGVKLGVPVCFSAIIREDGARHRMVIHPPFDLISTGDLEADVLRNLQNVTQIMERYIREYPSEYMWFYKIWKYSDQSLITILSDGKTGHLRQSQEVARMTQQALAERQIKGETNIIEIQFKSRFAMRIFSVLSLLSHPFVYQGRLESLKWFLTEKSFREIAAMKTDFIISCGSSVAGVNSLLAKDSSAKSVVVLKPGLLNYRRFDLVVLPRHDAPARADSSDLFAVTVAAPNVITDEYLNNQVEALVSHYGHLKNHFRPKLGLLIGGDSKDVFLSERQMKILARQVKQAVGDLKMDILVATSRRTPPRIEQLLYDEFKQDPACGLLVLANRNNIPEAVGGILGLSDIVIVSGDSLSMVSEAASSGKKVLVFPPQMKAKTPWGGRKHVAFIHRLNAQGYILLSDVSQIGSCVCDMVKGKIQTKRIDDHATILEAVRKVI